MSCTVSPSQPERRPAAGPLGRGCDGSESRGWCDRRNDHPGGQGQGGEGEEACGLRERGTLVVQEGRDPSFLAQIPCSRPNVGDGGWTRPGRWTRTLFCRPCVCRRVPVALCAGKIGGIRGQADWRAVIGVRRESRGRAVGWVSSWCVKGVAVARGVRKR